MEKKNVLGESDSLDKISLEDESKKVTSLIAKYESFKGPLPPPHLLAKYDQIQKGLADRIISMAERQSAHRQELERKVISSNILNERTGMHYAFLLTVVFIFFSGVLIYLDKGVAGYITLGTIIVGHAYNYISQLRREEGRLDSPENKE